MIRTRLFLLGAVVTLVLLPTAAAASSPTITETAGDMSWAQGDADDSETEGETGGGEGQTDPESETQSGQEGSEPAEPETGPPWTYQMARIGLVLLVFLALAIGLAYYRFVASRQRGAA